MKKHFYLIAFIFIYNIVIAQDETQGYVEVVNPNIEIDIKLKQKNQDYIYKHTNQQNKKKLLPVLEKSFS